MPRKVVATEPQRVLVERCGHDSLDDTALREVDGPLERPPSEATSVILASAAHPCSHDVVNGSRRACRTHNDQLCGCDDCRVPRGGDDDFGTDAARIADSDGEPRTGGHLSAPGDQGAAGGSGDRLSASSRTDTYVP